MWINGVREGEGTMRWINKNQIYLGHWKNNKQVEKIFEFILVFVEF
jgi:hypothetical protein